MKKRSWLMLLAFLMALPLMPASSQKQENKETWTRIFPVKPLEPIHFSFRDIDGSLKVLTHEEPEIRIRVTKEALTRDKDLATRLLAGTKIKINQKDNRFEMEILYPRLRTFFFPFRDSRRIKVLTEIVLPRGANLKADLVDGGVSLTGKFKEVQITTVDGSILSENVKGKLKFKTVDGSIRISQGKGEVETITVDGEVILNGEIETLKVQTTDGDIRIDLASGAKISQPWQLRTVDGDIEVCLPADLSADLNIETIDGSILCDLKMALMMLSGKKQISGRLNQGGPLIYLRTIDGRIWLKEKLSR